MIQGNTIGGLGALANGQSGIYDASSTILIGGTIARAGNLIAYNGGSGIYFGSTPAENSEVRRNDIIGNVQGGVEFNAGTIPNVTPVITESTIRGGYLTVTGTAAQGSVIEFSVGKAEQGATYLGTGTEGSLNDNDPTAGAFKFSLPIPSTYLAGETITAIAVEAPRSPTDPTLESLVSTFADDVVSDSGPAFGGPVVNAGGGGTVVAGATFSSQGSFTDTTSESWTATVDYGDGTGVQTLHINPVSFTASSGDQYSNVGAATYNLSHVFAKANTYVVTITIKNDSGETGTSQFTVIVIPAAPVINNSDITISPAIISENQSVTLTGKFTDVNPGVTHTVLVTWGDLTTSLATVNEAAKTFTATHTYLDPGTINSASGVYSVDVGITSSVHSSAQTTHGLFYVRVDDVPPTNLVVNTEVSTVSEGGVVTLSGSFHAVGPLDTHNVTINWGDGSALQTFGLGAGVFSFDFTHPYLHYQTGYGASADTISVSVSDLYQPLNPATASTSVSVTPVAPTNVVVSTDPATIDEGNSVTLSGSFSIAPNTLDHHKVTINWGDGTTSPPIFLGAGVTQIPATSHTYHGNSLEQPNGAYTITVTVIDPNAPAGSELPAVGTASVVVNDIASTVSNLDVKYADGTAIPIIGSYPQVSGGSNVTVTGQFSTPDPLDHYSVTVNWGDGSETTNAMTYITTDTFKATHLYADSAPGELLSVNDIQITVTDLEQVSGTGDIALAVSHVAPVDQIRSGGVDASGDQVLTAQISGKDPSPIVSYKWIVDGVVQIDSPTSQFILPSTPNTSYTVQSIATDTQGASSTFTARVDVLDDSASTYIVPDPGTGFDAVFVSALSGNHTVIGGNPLLDADGNLEFDSNGIPILTTKLTVPIIFDGSGTETYIGDSANDVFYLHTDNSIAYGEGGNNIFELTPNCTLTAVVGAGQNTLDFSSSTYGVTFNLAETSGQKQDVDPTADPGNHFVIAAAAGTGTFSSLVGSGKNDTITAASNTTIQGGGGSDTINLVSTNDKSLDNVNIVGNPGASDASTLVATGPNIGNISFQGDSGTDVFNNMGTITGTINYSGGADAGSFNNMGTITGTINYGAGADGGTFNNMGNVFGGLVYGGGADANTLLNSAGGTLGSIVFNGDLGATHFMNEGMVTGTINYNGGADSNTFVNDNTISSISFQGDTGADQFTNNGTVTGTIVFTGGADHGADQLLNAAGATAGGIVFTGGSDANLLVNQANGVSSITFTGGGDANVLNNTGSDFGTITFNGDTGADTFTNAGTGAANGSSSLVFQGGADSGTLINSGSGLGSISYSGDLGSSTLVNQGSNIGSIVFGGGADGGAFLNTGNNVSTITYNAGADANVFRNDGTEIGTITFNGDQGSNYLLNNGTVSNIIFTGGSDASTLVNNGTVGLGSSTGGSPATGLSFQGDTGVDQLINTASGTINGLVFTGGADAGNLINAGTLNTATISFQGGSGANQFVNQAGGSASNITYNAGSDTDAFINYGNLSGTNYHGGAGAGSMYLDGTKNADVIYIGGASGDELIIGPDALFVSNILFKGDAGADLLANEAAGASGITFEGGADAGRFWNLADNVSGLLFMGGAGADTFFNQGSNVSDITFSGDTGADTFTNSGSIGAIVFNGGSDANTFTNSGSSVNTIVYNAGSDRNTLTNTGMEVASITFKGDTGIDTVMNSGANVGSITFTGGSDYGDSLINSGANVDSITFVANGPAATFTNSGKVGTLAFTGGTGGSASLIYSANGAADSTVTFTGHGGDNIFVDSGSGGSINVNLGDGNNQAVIMTGASGPVDVGGGAGNNTYLFSGTPTANVTIDQALYASAGSMQGNTFVSIETEPDLMSIVGRDDLKRLLGGMAPLKPAR